MAGIALLLVVAVPVLAANRSGANRAACVNNLSRVGRAFSMFASDHGQRFPSQVLYPDGVLDTQSTSRTYAWFHFAFLSNELATPTILACPSDSLVSHPKDFSRFVMDQDFALSYFVAHPRVENGRTLLAGDRNIVSSVAPQPCQYFGGARAYDPSPLATGRGWSGDLHNFSGNLLFVDGSVQQTDNAGLQASVTIPDLENGFWHYLTPHNF